MLVNLPVAFKLPINCYLVAYFFLWNFIHRTYALSGVIYKLVNKVNIL